MVNNLAVVIVLIMVASLSVAGCTVSPTGTSSPTPSPTPNPTPVDYSSAFTNASESTNFIMERPFTKSINERGNDVYKGVGRNATNPGGRSVTIVYEVAKSEKEAKTVYDEAVATKLKQG